MTEPTPQTDDLCTIGEPHAECRYANGGYPLDPAEWHCVRATKPTPQTDENVSPRTAQPRQPDTSALRTTLDTAYREADDLDSNHARWVLQRLADRLGVEVTYPPVSEPNNRLREQLADCEALRSALEAVLGVFPSTEGDAEAVAAIEAARAALGRRALAALPPSAPPALDERTELAEAIFEAGVRQTMSQSEQAADNILAERAIIRGRLAQDRSPEPSEDAS